jgi:cytoskeletal protein CcmA (bactofilin family)
MIFQRTAKQLPAVPELSPTDMFSAPAPEGDTVETVVGPSVNVEGDFSSEGDIIVKGSVTGTVYTSRMLLVEQGAKIFANVQAGNAKISGEVKGNMKVRETLELSATARVLGDIEVRTLSVEPGAVLYGKVSMTGVEGLDTKPVRSSRTSQRKTEENPVVPASV